MTGDEFLGLTREEQDEMRLLGRETARYNNVNAIDELTQKFLDAGMLDDAVRVINLKDDAITYMKNTIYDKTGWEIEYNDSVQQWYNTENGHFMGKIGFERTLTDDEYEQAIIDKFGMHP